MLMLRDTCFDAIGPWNKGKWEVSTTAQKIWVYLGSAESADNFSLLQVFIQLGLELSLLRTGFSVQRQPENAPLTRSPQHPPAALSASASPMALAVRWEGVSEMITKVPSSYGTLVMRKAKMFVSGISLRQGKCITCMSDLHILLRQCLNFGKRP